VLPPSASDSLARERVQDALRGHRHVNGARVVANALSDTPLFSQCSKRELRLVAKLAKSTTKPAGTVLVEEGEAGDTMLVVLSGSAVVHQGNKKLAQLGAGDVVGELALLSRGARNATVTTTTEAEVAIIERRGLYRLLEDAPAFSRKLLEALANRIRDLDKKIVC
jgi:CRP/FNR family cyclic AMP-dependent transcriptional regulator